MGIEGYIGWLKGVIPTAFTSVNNIPKRFDRVYVDLNGFLHRSAYRSLTDSQVLSDCHRSLRFLLQRLRPREEFYVAADGPASTLKMRLQRERRLELGEELNRRGGDGFSALKFTPGTLFMGKMEDYLEAKLAKNIFNLKITLDGASNPGEGELKVIQQAIKQQDATICIVSFDSDAIIHALEAGIENLWIYNPQNELLFNAKEAKNVLNEKYGIAPEILRFFCLLSNFMGNDITSRFRYGSIKVLFPILNILIKADKLNPAEGELQMMRQLADAYIKNLSGSELQFYLSNERTHDLISDKMEARLALHWFLNQWLLKSISDGNMQMDLDLIPDHIGPILGDVLKVDPSTLLNIVSSLEKKHLVDSERLPKLPGAVALILFNPKSFAISYLPVPLQKLAATLDQNAWSMENCCKLMIEYSNLIQTLPRDEFTAEELSVTFKASPRVHFQKSNPPVPFIRRNLN